MDNNFQLLDILFLALVAGFLVMRLRSVLGKRDGYEQTPDEMARRKPDGKDNVVDINRARNGEIDGDIPDFRPVNIPMEGDFTEQGLVAIRERDPSFDPLGFLTGAKAAFEMIVVAFAEARLDDIQPYLGDEVYGNFKAGVQELQAAGEAAETQVIGIKSATITEAAMRGDDAVVSVKFVSEQVNIIRNADGEVVDGDPNYVEKLTDVWTFSRNVKSDDVNWKLMVTRSVEA
jgi:predicted lipid-binding transport protein (Tim44 family)